MSAEEVIRGLTQAREMIYQQPQAFPQMLQAVCGMAITAEHLEVQQWCSQFFIDVFSSEFSRVGWAVKQDSLNCVLPVLIKLSDIQDVTVYKNVVLATTCIYEMAFDLVAKISSFEIWNQISFLKSKIIQNWKTTYPLSGNNDDMDKFRSVGSKISALKFIARVIVVQCPPPQIVDPRRRGNTSSNEISVANLPGSHQVLNKVSLDAESQGLLDSLIDYLAAEEYLVPQLMICVIENLVYIIQRRKQFTHKVLQCLATLDLDAKYQHSKDKFIKFKLMKRFVERCIKNTLNYCIKAGMITQQTPQHGSFQTLVSSIDARMIEQKKKGILTELPGEKARRKIKVDPKNPFVRDSMTVDDNSYTSLYQLIDETNPLLNFDVSLIPHETLANIAIATIANADSDKLITALSIVSARYTDLISKAGGSVPRQTEVKEEDLKNEDLDNERILNAADDFNLESTFVLPEPIKLAEDEKKKHLQLIIQNFFTLSRLPTNDKSISSFNTKNEQVAHTAKVSNVAINDWGKNSWLVLLTRLTTRGLRSDNNDLSDQIRESIFQYFLDNIQDRIDVIIEWLNEEWYTEFMKNCHNEEDSNEIKTPTYLRWAEKVLDSMIPFLESTHRKIFLRLLSELPYLNASLVSHIKSLCIDPQRSTLGFQSLQFLILFRPPLKSVCIDILRDFYDNSEDLKTTAAGLLKKYDPDFKGDAKKEGDVSDESKKSPEEST
jgi:symplekin